MSVDARKKERKRLKRKEKKNRIRREHGGSPYARIARKGEIVECRINTDWRKRGQATALVLRRAPGGGLAMAVFLVDLWCCGLKDVWGRLDVTREEVDELIEKFDAVHGCAIGKVQIEEIARVIGGGLRFAVQNGFRLPPHHGRWTAFAGELGDWQHAADLTYFGVDGEPGKLRYVGPMWDLRNRLIGSSLEAFMARSDVEVVILDDDDTGFDYEADDDDEADEQEMDDDDQEDAGVQDLIMDFVHDTLFPAVQAVRGWCLDNNLVAHPQLGVAVFMAMLSDEILDEIIRGFGGDPAMRAEFISARDAALAQLSDEQVADITLAREQLRQYLAQFATPAEILAAWERYKE